MKIHTQNVVEKLVPGLFIKNHNWADLWTNSLTFYTVCLFYVKLRALKILWNSCKPLDFTSYKTFFKSKKRSGTSFPCLIFCMIFEEKCFSCHVLLIYQVSWCGYGCLYFLRYEAICVLQLFVNQFMTS